jgi:hypothetical protein
MRQQTNMHASGCVECLQHAEKLQEDDFKRKIAGNDMLEPVLRNHGVCDSEETKSSSENGLDICSVLTVRICVNS